MNPLVMANPPMIMPQNSPQSVYCMIKKVKVHFFPKWGLLEGLFFQKCEFRASKCAPVTVSFPHANFKVQNKAESVYMTIKNVKVCFVSK